MAATADDTKTPPTDDAQLARQWIAELDAADKDEDRKNWLARCKAIIADYTEKRATKVTNNKRFSLFWSNIEVLKPATLARMPTAVASRRFKDSDPIGRKASEVLERALNFSIESFDFEGVLKDTRDEYLLLAQGVTWVRYVPTIKTEHGEGKSEETTDDGEGYEVVDWEEVIADNVHYEDYYHNVARKWPEVWWQGRRTYLTRDELCDRFGEELGSKIPLDYSPKDKPDAPEWQKKAAIYEIWDIKTKRAIWISRGWTEAPLDVRPDPLKLKGFFPAPKPALGTVGPNSVIPTPDYIYYQDQCDEIDVLTARIGKLIAALKVKGFYSAADGSDLNNLLSADDNVLIPVDSWAALGDKGGLKGIIEWLPLDVIALTIKACIETRKEIISDVYQVTGISDIARGDTDPDETAAAQKLKASFGSSRNHERKKEMARVARDTLNLMGQIIASRFDWQTLSQMTDVNLLTNAEKQQVQQQVQAFQQAQQMAQQAAQQPPQPGTAPQPPPPMPPPPDPKQVALLSECSVEDVMGLLRNPKLLAFRIDIETDSTIEPDDQEEKQRRIEFVTAVGKFVAESLPVIQAQPAMLPVITQSLLFLVRGFRVGREMEDVIEQALDKLAGAPPAPPAQAGGPNPQAEQMKAQAAQTNAQANVMKAQAAQGHLQVETQKVTSQHQIGMAQVEAEQQRTQVDAHVAQTGNAIDHAQGIADIIQRAAERRDVKEINDQRPITAPTR